LTDVQYDAVRTPAFKNWFGDWESDPKNASKVVDKNGEPLPQSHFTNNYFDVFKHKESGFHFGEPSIKEDLEIAKGFQLENELNVFLNIRNPLAIEDSYRFDPPILIKQLLKNSIINKKQFKTLQDLFYDIEEKSIKDGFIDGNDLLTRQSDALIKVLRNEGYDGLVYENQFDSQDSKMSYLIDEKSSKIYVRNSEGVFVGDVVLESESKTRAFMSFSSNEGNAFVIENPSGSKLTSKDNKRIKELLDAGGYISTVNSSKTYSDFDLFTRPKKFTDSYVTFESNQSKLADGSNTTFDPNKQSIRKQKESRTDKMQADSDKNIKDRAKKNKSFWPKIRELFFDRQTQIKMLLKGIKNPKALRAMARLVTKAGATGYANFRFKKADKEIYGGLSKEEVRDLNSIIYNRRIVSINENRKERGMPPYVGKDGFSDRDAQDDLDLKRNNDPARYGKLNKRADRYFQEFSDSLDRLYKSGRISEEVYDNLKNVEYSPIKTIKYLLLEGEDVDKLDRIANQIGMSTQDIKSLSNENENDIIFDSRWLLLMNISATESKVFENNMLKAFNEATESMTESEKEGIGDLILENPVVGKKKDGSKKYKYDSQKVPAGYSKISFYEDGVKKTIILKSELASQLLDIKENNKHIQFAAKWSGANILRFFATGGNPLFIVGNTAVDFANILLLSDVYSNNKILGGAQLAWDFVSAFVRKVASTKKYNEIYQEFMEHGGAMDYLSIEGLQALKDLKVYRFLKPAQKTFVKLGEFMSYLGQTSEVAFRIAVYEKTKDNLIKEYRKENKGKDPVGQELEDIKFEAARESRETIDFSQGGTGIKAVDPVMPYLNAAMQGVRKATDYAQKNPKQFASNTLQLMGMAAAVSATSMAMLIAKLKDDEEDPEKILEILNSVSDFEKSHYHIVFTGNKNEEGEYEYKRFKKLPVTAAAATIAESLIYKLALKAYGVKGEYQSEEAIKQSVALAAPIIPTELASRNPAVSAYIAYALNYDTFRKQDIFRGPKSLNVNPEVEGLEDERVAGIYKFLGTNLGFSPKRSQAAVEKIITSESTNPFVSAIYAATGGLYSKDHAVGEEVQNVFEKMMESAGKKITRYTNRKLLDYKDDDIINEIEANIESEIYLKQQKTYSDIRRITKETGKKPTVNQIYEIVKERFDPIDHEKYLKKFYRSTLSSDISRPMLDLLYEENPEVQAARIYQMYGDNLDAEEHRELIKAVVAAMGKKPSAKTWYLYDKMRKK
tara:strand:- start:46 stop:3768 length:3723 start_codon:yes stop_codon:yes gene_type:complete